MSKGTATEVKLCGHMVRLGDYVKVRYSSGRAGTIEGEVIELWGEEGEYPQGRVSNFGRCFHAHDEILEHRRAGMDISATESFEGKQ